MNGNVRGFEELIAKFKAMGGDFDAVVTRAVRQEAEVVRAAAVKLCPVNHGELRDSIHTLTLSDGGAVVGKVYTTAEHAVYVEFGTGPIGAANHEGVSPYIPVSYKNEPWWFPVSDPSDADKYGWITSETKDGTILARTSGQAAQPFMYPAMKQNQLKVLRGIQGYIARSLQKYCEGGTA